MFRLSPFTECTASDLKTTTIDHDRSLENSNTKQKELVQRQGRQLKGTNYRLNEQYTKDILEHRKRLFPIWKQMINEGKMPTIVVDKLYMDGQLHLNKDINSITHGRSITAMIINL